MLKLSLKHFVKVVWQHIVHNRVRVALSTANPPHTHCTTSFPTYGIADRRFVITLAPQKDICPHGRTYSINAVAMVRKRTVEGYAATPL
jgi:hypothetical protein